MGRYDALNVCSKGFDAFVPNEDDYGVIKSYVRWLKCIGWKADSPIVFLCCGHVGG